MSHPPLITSHLSVRRSALICASQPINIGVNTVWFVLHGYGERAEEFLEYFRPFMNEQTLFVAPEALSRFYRRNRMDEVGASWMTSVDRDAEISDYTDYLDCVYEHVLDLQGARPDRIGVLGFSQGSSTASRWAYSGVVKPDRLVLWGGAPAKELRNFGFQKKLSSCSVDWVTGTNDRFTPPEILQDLLTEMDSVSNPIRVTVFDGGHELNPETLSDVIIR